MTAALLVVGVLFTILVNVLASEFYEWLPALAVRMVRLAASRLPRMSDRYCEEWTAHLDEIPGHGAKFVSAVWLLLRLPQLRRDLPREKASDVTVELRGVSATGSVGTLRAEPVTNSTGEVKIHGPAPTSLGLAGGTPQVVIGTVVPSMVATVFEGWESVSDSSAYHHYERNIRRHPAYGTTVSHVILPPEGPKSEST